MSALVPFLRSSLDDSAEVLRARMANEGYLFFPRLIPDESLLDVRRDILTLCSEAGWLNSEHKKEEGIAASGVAYIEGQPEFMQVYNRLQHSEAFHALAHEPNLLDVLEQLFGEQPLPHARNIARIIFPQNVRFTTPSHQDYIHIQGTEETYTAWIPLGECPKELGSLAVLRGSHNLGILPVHKADGAGGLGIDTDSLPNEWTGGDFGIGDVILFHSLTVHKALPNSTSVQIRLSVDFRYQPLSHPVHSSSMEPHHGQVQWNEVYRDWKDSRLQYYWQRLPVNYTDLDPRVQTVRAAAL